ncbi:hypothetical protein M0R45_026385 [Rubus argutus]|uniref:Uncharacterized protein n=1 Tax=Rubus argutus TaxID=59490 RepID=A0AAW1WXG5_RUBAR
MKNSGGVNLGVLADVKNDGGGLIVKKFRERALQGEKGREERELEESSKEFRAGLGGCEVPVEESKGAAAAGDKARPLRFHDCDGS